MSSEIDAGALEKVTLAECPIGLFVNSYGGLCLKTEYGSNEGLIDAYIVSSGEFFWGEAPQTIESQRRQLVTPIDLDRLAPCLADATPFFAESAKNSEPAAMPGVEEIKAAIASAKLRYQKERNKARAEMGLWPIYEGVSDDALATAVLALFHPLAQENERLKAECETVCNSYVVENQQLHDRAEAAETRALAAEAERDAALLASRHETDLCQQALESLKAAEARALAAEQALAEAVKAERERCAKVAEDPRNGLSAWRTRERIASAIRAGEDGE